MSRAVSHCFALVILRTGRTGGKSAIGKAITAESTRHDTPTTAHYRITWPALVSAYGKKDLPESSGRGLVSFPACGRGSGWPREGLVCVATSAPKMDDDRETQKIHHETSPLVGDVVPKKGADGAGEADSQDREATFKDDVLDTLHLAGPIFVSRVSWVGVSWLGARREDLFPISHIKISRR